MDSFPGLYAGPCKVPFEVPCPLGLPGILSLAHLSPKVEHAPLRVCVGSALPGKPVAFNYGQRSVNDGLLWGIVAQSRDTWSSR